MGVVATGTGIHGGNHHEVCRIVDGVLGTADGDMAVFQGLSQQFKYMPRKFREFITKEHAIVGKANLPRLRIRTASDKGYGGDGVMG